MTNNAYTLPMSATNRSQRLRQLMIILVLVAVTLTIWLIHHASTLHIIKTDPGLSNVSYISPYLDVYFSQDIEPSSVKVNFPTDAVNGYVVEGKILRFELNRQLPIGHSYNITIDQIVSKAGKHLQGKNLSFITQKIEYQQMSASQQKAVVASQDTTYSLYNMPFDGFDSLTNGHLTSDQINLVRQAFFSYSQVNKQQFNTLSLKTNSAQNSVGGSSDDPIAITTFEVTGNSKTYLLQVTATGLSNADVLIKDASGAVVYDSTKALEY